MRKYAKKCCSNYVIYFLTSSYKKIKSVYILNPCREKFFEENLLGSTGKLVLGNILNVLYLTITKFGFRMGI